MLAWVVSLNACMVMPSAGADSWKEEVLLHDGRKIIVQRSQTYGPKPVIAQWPNVREHTLRFSIPGSTRELRWTAEFAEDTGGYVEFVPLALHVLQSTAYVIATPVGCLGYNKWGRPNPPYVVLRHDGKTWQRVPLAELPTEFMEVNLVVSASAQYAQELSALRLVDVANVRRLNASTQPPELRSILRGPIQYDPQCTAMISNGKGSWRSSGFFTRIKTLDACEAACRQENFDDQHCPCKKQFEGK
jgi:hypothetical protein